MAPTPSKQWWSLNGQMLLDVLHRCHDGEDPEIMYLELLANADTVDVGKDDDD